MEQLQRFRRWVSAGYARSTAWRLVTVAIACIPSLLLPFVITWAGIIAPLSSILLLIYCLAAGAVFTWLVTADLSEP